MLIEIKLKIGHNSIFNISQANFKSSHLLNKIAHVQFQRKEPAAQTFSGKALGPKTLGVSN